MQLLSRPAAWLSLIILILGAEDHPGAEPDAGG
jgi:hypothetical protein